ncbi:SAM-dependent methyltransferase [Paenibacillus darwinianus]|uniref:SAM-dependent methyltransferase n=1 Tax=Paenibacillus darwinianus TaxID=1380763 RepID=A0A9W5S255_9BACL|nr:class I SAM-dependent methyltransferase [Paenibacillus darwinianus]EXX90217.1 SAM-dependent methyltransferase [Paenibacillus darwinianus]
MIVTTAGKPAEEVIAKAAALARELDGRFVRRGNETLAGIRRKQSDDKLLVVRPEGIRLYDGDEPALYFHPSMAFVRSMFNRLSTVKNPLEIAGCEPGDSVLDCTAGLAADAIVFSYAVGAGGTVAALESEALLHAVVREGLQTYDTGLPDVNEALRRIVALRAHHLQALAAMPDRSRDIVYFDPMFGRPLRESSALEPIRTLANDEPLAAEAIEHARRVARKTVVLKEHRDSGEFDRLGFERARPRNTSKITYGVIRI